MTAPQIASILIFVAVMGVIISEKMHRTTVAMIGACVVMLSGLLPFDEAVANPSPMDLNTLAVLIGMMIFVAVAKESGLFEYAAIWAAKLAHGHPWRIMMFLIIVTAVLSAFLDNVTTVLLVGPMTFMLCREMKTSPIPFFISQIMASNIGGTATMIGDPPNIMIGSQSHYDFLDFLNYNAPIVIVILAVTIICFYFLYGRKLKVSPDDARLLTQLDPGESIKSKPLFFKSIVMIILIIAAFLLHGSLGIESGVVALSAGGVMLVIGRQDIEKIIHEVEWTTIGFFAGLFIIVGAMSHTGVLNMLAQELVHLAQGQEILALVAVLVVSAVVSAFLDNIPFVAAMIPVLTSMGAMGIDVHPLWWGLSIGACLGGNGTLIGASANVVLSGISNKKGYPISFLKYMRVGFPLMLVSVAIAGVYIVFRFHIAV
ncbi:MAG: ArsB/NhaD family transporter [Coriobacteriales bacterium]|jgi:Na+/H+ antiporter NhaD/arsenite permease-like protein|nr:ArsB/NhaD family transporter [Coriobacteriales bacterium]